ncbi:translation initiation factor IF-2 [Enterococcus sp. PF1-24]|uniref:translation initiation factor IF-2 n=1 Tax=unclassified Enterococcus TaxID=2608891 RepID=UPI00247536D8|nr:MULTISPECIES: translation initiation factor IF-2 [unclassified Enterococcus]MDH6363039.1 translation initiation factor IF-2 [Enterococcus sp. PFB1-1]MDH6400133.1 translation initiation factor IF-2 [Enterococcus sp. PF1-24]
MGKIRIYELAKELDKSSKDIVTKAQEMGMSVKNHMGAISEAEATQLKGAFGKKPTTSNQSVQEKPAKQQPANQNATQQGTKEKKIQGRSSLNNPNFVNRNQTKAVSVNKNGKVQHGQPGNKNQRPQEQGKRPVQNQKPNQKPIQKASEPQRDPSVAAKSLERARQQVSNLSKQETVAPRQPYAKGDQAKNQNRNQQSQNQNSKQGQQTNRPMTQQNRPNQTSQNQNRPQGQNQNNRPQGNQGQNRPQNSQGQQNRPQNNQGQNRPQNNAPVQNRPQNTTAPARPATENAAANERKKNFGENKQKQRGGYNNYNQNRNRFNKKGKKGKQQPQSQKPAVPPRKFRELPDVLEYTEGMNVADIAKKIHREPAEIIKKLFMMGVMVNQNQSLDKDTIELLAVDYGMEAQEKIQIDIADIDKFFEPEELKEENLVSRPPVVTIMGHVDHGKTTLLDTLRNSRVTSGEAGGITQHIGAYQIDINGKPITFLDTPGHAAFTSMRARGASITDITILVVAADDGVMPQTVEAINHAKAANVPIIVAVNKIDKPGANPDRVMQELSEHGLIPEDWGGDTIFVQISAKFNQNIEELLEMILLVAEMEDLKADPTQRAIGTVIEARLDKGKGPVATLLVQQGTLNVGDPIVVGNTFGRVRVMTNDLGRRDKVAGPATPVEITGLNDVPQAGDRFVVFEDEKTARAAGEERGKRALLEQRAASSRVTLDNLFESLKEGELKDVNVIIKADVQGSAEALAASLQKIEVEGVRVKIVHSAVGAINESDVTLAAASNAIIIGFNVRPTPQAKQQAEGEEVDIRLHRIIYKAIDEIETAMKGMLDPEFEEKITGQMVVRELYKVSKVGTIAGCYVTEGSIQRESGVRVIRDGIVIFEGTLASLKRFKDDVKEVKLGFECGAMVENFNDLKVDDVIEGYVMEEIKND